MRSTFLTSDSLQCISQKASKIAFLSLLLWGCSFLFQAISAQTLYVVAAIDTTVDERIWQKDKENVYNFYNYVKDSLGKPVKFVNCIGKDFEPRSILNKLDQILLDTTVGSKSVLYYHSGHGTSGTYEHVELQFPNGEVLSSEEIEKILKKRSLVLGISIFDACKSELGQSVPILYPGQAYVARTAKHLDIPKDKSKGYQTLFLFPEGYLTIFSSRHGQVSFSTPEDGGVFSYYFFKHLMQEMRTENTPNWESLLKRANEQTELEIIAGKAHPSRTKELRQEPIYWGELSDKKLNINEIADKEDSKTPSERERDVLEEEKVTIERRVESLIRKNENRIAKWGRLRSQLGKPNSNVVVEWQRLFELEDETNSFYNETDLPIKGYAGYVTSREYINNWLSHGPNISTELVSISFPDEELTKVGRNLFLIKAKVERNIAYVQNHDSLSNIQVVEYSVLVDMKEHLIGDPEIRRFFIRRIELLGINPRIFPVEPQEGDSIPPVGENPNELDTDLDGGSSSDVPSNIPSFKSEFDNNVEKTLEQFTGYLKGISVRKVMRSEESQNIQEVEELFLPGAEIQVSSLNRHGYRSYSIRKYLSHLEDLANKKNRNRSYDRIDIQIEPLEILLQEGGEKGVMQDGHLVYRVKYIQYFRGYVDGESEPKYADCTSKVAEIHVIRNQGELDEKAEYFFKINDIEVISTLPYDQ